MNGPGKCSILNHLTEGRQQVVEAHSLLLQVERGCRIQIVISGITITTNHKDNVVVSSHCSVTASVIMGIDASIDNVKFMSY